MSRTGRDRHLIVVADPHARFMEGGQVRIFYLSQALDRLRLPVTYLPPLSVSSPRPFVRRLGEADVRRVLGDPRKRRYLVSHGVPPARRILRVLRRLCTPLVIDVHDDPRLQYPDLGIALEHSNELDVGGRRLDFSLDIFRYVGFVSEQFAAMYDVPPARRVIVPNASDPDYFRPTSLPDRNVVCLVGSTTRGRGADLLIEACRLARADVPDLELRLALSNVEGRGNLDELKQRYDHPWISYETHDYRTLPPFLAEATVCVVPHRRARYTDLALPIKLFDYMAAARPVVVTRCSAMASLVERERSGLAVDDRPEPLAAAISRLLLDRTLAAELAGNGRRAVEERYNWHETQDALIAALSAELARDER